MSSSTSREGTAAGGPRVPTPASGHHDAQWYRRAATKESAETDAPPDRRVSDDAAWSSVSLLAAGILVYGGIGWLIGHWLGHQDLFIAAGVLLGVALAMFMLFRRLDTPTLDTPQVEPETPRPVEQTGRTEDVVTMPDLPFTTPKETRS